MKQYIKDCLNVMKAEIKLKNIIGVPKTKATQNTKVNM